MSGNRKVSPENKLKAVQEYLAGQGSIQTIAAKYGVTKTPFRHWISKYKAFGDKAFLRTGSNASYSLEFKRKVVQSYLNGEGSLEELTTRFKIPSSSTVKQWILKYNILGYRQMTIKLNREHDFKVNKKRIYRLMTILHLKSVCRKKRKNYIKSTPQVTAENLLNRKFEATYFGEKWLTDVTEMKYGQGKKAYLSAILDLADKSIVSFVVGHSNNNKLVFETFDIAHKTYPNVTPLFHSDRGYQYTSRNFKAKLDQAGMTQSMSRVARCMLFGGC